MSTVRASTPVILNPKRSEHERVTQQLINQYTDYLKSIKTDWKVIKDHYGNELAIVPCWHIEFKDGSDFKLDLETASKRSSGQSNVH